MASGGIGTCVPTGAAAGECVPSFPSMAILLQIHLCRNSMRIIGCYEQETVALENTVPKGNLSSIRWWIYYTVVYWVVKPLHLSGILSFKVWRQRVWMRHYGSNSLKPTNLWCNSVHVKDLSLGKLTQDRGVNQHVYRPTTPPNSFIIFLLYQPPLWGSQFSKKSELIVLRTNYIVNILWCHAPVKVQRAGAIRLAEPYIDRFGKKRATGNRKRLKASQFFG